MLLNTRYQVPIPLIISNMYNIYLIFLFFVYIVIIIKLLKLYLRVKKLWLRFCQLKDKGVNNLLDILDETRRNTQLNSLYLDCNSITCKGAKQIAQVDCNYIYFYLLF